MARVVSDEVVEVIPLPTGSGNREWPPAGQPPAAPRRDRPQIATWPALRARLAGEHSAVAVLLGLTALCYLWALDRQGWANAFYSAAVEAGTKSWKAFFFGSFDSSSFITVDKPPASLWVMELSARLFGLNSWSLLAPQALEGVASVALLYRIVRRWFGWRTGVLAGAVLASTPVAALMFRFDNPDALLTLLALGATWATVRAIEDGRTRWLLLAAALLGTGFLTKMLQAFLVVPALAGGYLLAGPHRLGRRVRQLLAGAVALVVASGWWVAAVQLTPAADRPYVGGSTDNSELDLIFGYNGFGRLTGNETGSVTGIGSAVTSRSVWGPTGWDRMFLSGFGGQISWLLPAALLLCAAGAWYTWRRPRTDRLRAALVVFGGSLLVTDAVFSFGQGIIHPYYTVALAPPLAAVVAIGSARCWQLRGRLASRLLLAALVAGTATWSSALLDRSPSWLPWLRMAVLVAGGVSAAGLLGLQRLPLGLRRVVAATGLAAALAGPVAYTIDTVSTVQNGSLPSAGPTLAGAFGGPGGGAGGPVVAGPSAGGPGGGAGAFGRGGAARGAVGPPPGIGGGRLPGGIPGGAPGGSFAGGRTGSRSGGLLQASTPGAALVRLLESDASPYRWVAATVGANTAAGYQLATDGAVMAIGGFNGTDPAPSLRAFEHDVAMHEVHWFIAARGAAGGAGPGGASTSSVAAEITSWVESHFSARTVDGTTVYDLSSAAGR